MRLVQVMVPTGKQEAVLGVLEDEEVDYVLTEEASHRDYTAVVSFPLPTAAVEPVLEDLREAGIDREAYTVVLAAETVVSSHFDKLAARYEEENDQERLPREELVARAADLAPSLRTFVIMTVISSIVATVGLLLNSPAVVVGSMVIAPLIGPAMATSVGTVVDDDDLFVRGVKLQVLGGFLAVASAGLFAVLLRQTGIVPLSSGEVFAIDEVRERLAPDVLSLAVALGAGVAGALSVSSGVSSALVGVMIAAALVPPTAVVGIGLAWGAPTTVVGSGVLVLLNFLSINFTALVVLWWMGYRPERWFKLDEARVATVRRVAILGVSILLLTVFLAGVTYASYQTATFEREATDEVRTVATSYGLTLQEMTFEYAGFPVRQPTRVVVTLGYPPGIDPPELAETLADRVNAVADPPFLRQRVDVTVEVRYIQVETSPRVSTERTGGTDPLVSQTPV